MIHWWRSKGQEYVGNEKRGQTNYQGKKNPSGRKNIPKEGLANNTRKGHETIFESTSHIRDDVKIN